MQLERLIIHRQEFDWQGYKKGDMKGTIEFKGDYGKIEIALRPEQLQPILDVVAAALVEQTKIVATHMTIDIISSSKALPAPIDAAVVPTPDIPF